MQASPTTPKMFGENIESLDRNDFNLFGFSGLKSTTLLVVFASQTSYHCRGSMLNTLIGDYVDDSTSVWRSTVTHGT